MNTSSLTARRDSFDRNTSAFSPSLDFNTSSVAAVAAANGNGTASRKWPVNNYGAMASVSPLAPGTPPPTGKYILKFNLMLQSLDISILIAHFIRLGRFGIESCAWCRDKIS